MSPPGQVAIVNGAWRSRSGGVFGNRGYFVLRAVSDQLGDDRTSVAATSTPREEQKKNLAVGPGGLDEWVSGDH
jgi:hypothetical protein